MKNTNNVNRSLFIGIFIGAALCFSDKNTVAAVSCWDTIYHPGLTTECECDEVNSLPCYTSQEIDKFGWYECPASLSGGGPYEGPCIEVNTLIGTQFDCAGALDSAGIDSCMSSIYGLGVSVTGIAIPTGIIQIAGFVGAVITGFGVLEDCRYCELVACVKSSHTSFIWRSAIPDDCENLTECGAGSSGGM